MFFLFFLLLTYTGDVFSIGDEVEVIIVSETENEGDNIYSIQNDGSIILPLVGRIHVVGLTIEQAQDTISFHLRDIYRDPTVYVIPHWKVTILGFAKVPGVYTVQGGATVSRLLALAGGQDSRADLKRAILYRDGEGINLNIVECIANAGTDKDLSLKSGDVIYIPKVWWPSWTEWGAIMTTVTFFLTVYSFTK